MLSILIPSKNEQNIDRMMMVTEEEFPEAQIVVANDRYGRGKGWALREALKHAEGDIIVFIDGDFDIDPWHIHFLIDLLEGNDIVVGRKLIGGRFDRQIITLCSRAFIGLLFGLWCDTQTGIKVFRRSVLPAWENDSFAFDLEILSIAKSNGARIVECPVEVNIKKGMPGRSILRFIHGALQIKWRLLCANVHQQ